MEAVGRTVVIGLGNEFRRDDGVGWAVAGLLRRRAEEGGLPPGVVVAQCDGDPGRLIELWENAGLAIVVDACFPPAAEPGRTHRWDDAAGGGPGTTGSARHSTHGLGFAEAVDLGRALGRSPRRLIVYAVEGADLSPGLGMTPAVACVVPRLLRRITADIERHGRAADDARCRKAGPPAGTRRTKVTARRPSA
ncbi:hydrogenase maturation protease [Streptomyces yangpuensis]|uniref:hydrogenase maturation protease n=1 Tax=Streptomyces yangpuensis TaxID=1648182 RepID=UPI0006293B1C|nr:hydrogenase maturation protease [Streptomyces yangpuensis]